MMLWATLWWYFHQPEPGAQSAANSTQKGDAACAQLQSQREAENARHNALMASLALAPGTKAMTTDVAVPVSELAAAIEHARRALDESGLLGGIVGHVGDGNFHVAFLLDPDDDASIAQAEGLNATLVDDALARGGTCTGEHGIGFGKLRYLEREHGDLVPLYRGIKQLLDPNGILNPGKVVP